MKKHYLRQQDNLLYEKLFYTGEFFQQSKFSIVVYDKKSVIRKQSNDIDKILSFIKLPGVK